MHFAEALMPRDEAVAMAADTLRAYVDRCAPYFAGRPELRPDPARPLLAQVRAEDAWYFIPFARGGEAAGPVVVRVNALTRTARLDPRA
jgi:hypothetical protein